MLNLKKTNREDMIIVVVPQSDIVAMLMKENTSHSVIGILEM
jgi:hypothetical protein